jgi:hypothetical protein
MDTDKRIEQLGVDLTAENGQKSRGGLKNLREMQKDSIQRVFGEYLSPTFKPKVTFALDSLTFNMACVNLFPENQYIAIDVDEENKRVIIGPTDVYDRDGLKFATYKKHRNTPRKCMAHVFCAMVYDMMGWHHGARYRCLAIYQVLEGKQIIVFNLDECLQVFTEVIMSDDDKKKRKVTINMPPDWKDRFGYTLEELEEKNRLDTIKTLVRIDNHTGERYPGGVIPKLPTPEELMHRPYGGIRFASEDSDENE